MFPYQLQLLGCRELIGIRLTSLSGDILYGERNDLHKTGLPYKLVYKTCRRQWLYF